MAEEVSDRPFRIDTERLVLRDWQRGDVAPFVRHTNTPAVMRWLGGVQDEAFFAATFERFEECRSAYGHCFWLVERQRGPHALSGEILGFCGLKRTNVAGAPMPGAFEIGWRMREDAWGQGFALEAAKASLAVGFQQFRAPCINAITVVQNRASWGLMERLGMKRAPQLDFRDERFGEEIANVIAYSIGVAAWRDQNSAPDTA